MDIRRLTLALNFDSRIPNYTGTSYKTNVDDKLNDTAEGIATVSFRKVSDGGFWWNGIGGYRLWFLEMASFFLLFDPLYLSLLVIVSWHTLVS